jgi:hypothetical protein
MGLMDLRVEEQDLSAGDLELEAREGESLRIIARGVAAAAAGTIVEEWIREETMVAYPSDDGDEAILKESVVERRQTDLMAVMRDMGYRAPELSIPEGQTYKISSSTDTGSATVLYEEMAAGSAAGGQPGGPGTKTRTFVSTGQVTADLTAEAGPRTLEVDETRNPSQLDGWPFAEDVASNYEFDLQALALQASVDSTDTGASLDRFKLTSDESDFLARDSDLVDADHAQFPNADGTTMPLMFDPAITFSPGSDLDLTVEVSGADDGTVIVDAVMVFHRRAV